jgi:hypothetical protein
MKEKIIKWYKLGLWTKEMVENAVKKGVLTSDEAAEIING